MLKTKPKSRYSSHTHTPTHTHNTYLIHNITHLKTKKPTTSAVTRTTTKITTSNDDVNVRIRQIKGALHPWTLFLKNFVYFQKIKQLLTKYPMDLTTNVPKN